VAAAPQAAETGGFSVQVGAFASEANALKLADDLTGRGYPRVRLERGAGDDRLFHVRFGDYPDHAAAVKAGEEVSAALGLRYQIVPPPTPAKP
jgi:cell division septation protein DedD